MKSNWTTATIDEVCSLVTDGAHNSPKSVEKGYYMASVKDFTEYGFNFLNCRQISEEDYEKLRKQGCVPQKEDVLVGKDGARYFEDIIIYRQDEQPALLSSIAILRANRKKITPEFLYYTLKTPTIKKDVRDNYGSGSAIPRIVLKDFKRMPFSYPDIDEQRKITAVCSVIDEKIRVNNAINENLQQQANLFFDELVGRLIPTMSDSNCSLQLHEIGSLDILVTDYVANGSFKSLADNVQYLSQETDNVLIRLTDYNNNFSSDMVYISDESYNFLSKSKLYGDEIIISNVGANVGTVFRCPRLDKRMSLAPNAIMLRSDKYEHYLYLYFISHYGQQQLQSIVTGSAQPKFNKTNFRTLKVILPDEATLNKITDMYTPMYEQIVSNYRENKALANIRDSLLPKLMSGELDVSCVQI